MSSSCSLNYDRALLLPSAEAPQPNITFFVGIFRHHHRIKKHPIKHICIFWRIEAAPWRNNVVDGGHCWLLEEWCQWHIILYAIGISWWRWQRWRWRRGGWGWVRRCRGLRWRIRGSRISCGSSSRTATGGCGGGGGSRYPLNGFWRHYNAFIEMVRIVGRDWEVEIGRGSFEA